MVSYVSLIVVFFIIIPVEQNRKPLHSLTLTLFSLKLRLKGLKKIFIILLLFIRSFQSLVVRQRIPILRHPQR